MKVYVNRTPKVGPWGGGIKTVNKLVDTLRNRGHDVVFELQNGIDVIFCIDPRPNERGEWYQHFLNYRNSSPFTKIIQRVGDLGTHSKPELTDLVKQTLLFSDFFIFPSDWAHEFIGFAGENYKIIDNAPMSIFHDFKRRSKVSKVPKIVTHHWSMNPKKGFETYRELNSFCDETSEFEFTYIGRCPQQVKLSNHIQPVSALELAKILPNYDIYITASIEEAGANHVLEAMAAGLPVIYHKSGGSINNYCHEYGEEFSTTAGLIEKVRLVLKKYEKYKDKVLEYKADNLGVIDQYIRLIEEV